MRRAMKFGMPCMFQLHEYVSQPKVYVCYEWEQYLAIRRKLYPQAQNVRYSYAKTSKIEFADGNIAYVVGVFNGRKSTLVHELDHLATMVLADQGIKHDTDDGEPHCYLLEGLCAMLGIDDAPEEPKPCSTQSKRSWLPTWLSSRLA